MSIDGHIKDVAEVDEPSAIKEPTVFEDAAKASTIATDLVNDEAA